MASDLIAHLTVTFEDAAARLPAVEKKKMFGCEGFFTGGTIFGLIWKTGRIGVKLPDPARYAAAMALDGASTWSPGGKMTMTSWVLLPEEMHDDEDALRDWIAEAHGMAGKKQKPKAKAKAKAKAKPKRTAKSRAR